MIEKAVGLNWGWYLGRDVDVCGFHADYWSYFGLLQEIHESA